MDGFEGFALTDVETPRGTVRARVGGDGPPLLLLHGFPQTHVMWHPVAAVLAGTRRVVAPDLPGYGASFRPRPADDHAPHSKRALANDVVAAMEQLGHERFAVAGHDRGGRVAYRMALDHPETVTRLAVLDIVPTGEIWRRADASFGSRFLGGPHRVLYFWHSVGNRVLTTYSNMLTNLNLTDMETCYKAMRGELARAVAARLTSDRFGFEPEITARLARMDARIFEVPISYSGRTYAEGKKIGWRDGVAAFWHITKFNLFA